MLNIVEIKPDPVIARVKAARADLDFSEGTPMQRVLFMILRSLHDEALDLVGKIENATTHLAELKDSLDRHKEDMASILDVLSPSTETEAA